MAGLARPPQHLPAADHRGVRPGRGGAGAALPARPRRRLGLPLADPGRGGRQRARLRRRRPLAAIDPDRGGGGRAGRRCRPRPGGSAWACWSTSCPTTSASPRRASNAWWWDVLHPRPRPRRYAGAFDIDWAAGGGRLRIPVAGRRGRRRPRRQGAASAGRGGSAALPRPVASRWRPAPPTTGEPDDADTVHARQHYELVELAAWPTTELNYRRFFAVNTLAAVRVEDPEVFAETHAEIGALVRRGPGRRAAGRPPRRAARPGRLPRRPGRAHRRRLRPGREDPRARRAAAAGVGDRRHHRLRRPRAASTGCSPTRRARRR